MPSYERVWARPHVTHKVRAVFGIPVNMKASSTNNVFWTQATDSRQFVPVFHNLKCHHFQGQNIRKLTKAQCFARILIRVMDAELGQWTLVWNILASCHWFTVLFEFLANVALYFNHFCNYMRPRHLAGLECTDVGL